MRLHHVTHPKSDTCNACLPLRRVQAYSHFARRVRYNCVISTHIHRQTDKYNLRRFAYTLRTVTNVFTFQARNEMDGCREPFMLSRIGNCRCREYGVGYTEILNLSCLWRRLEYLPCGEPAQEKVPDVPRDDVTPSRCEICYRPCLHSDFSAK